MCGIGAVFNNKRAKELLEKSLQKVNNRGTRKLETGNGKLFALGANRLPIIDRANATQPTKSEFGDIFCVLNGEIFNHYELRSSLEKKGHRFGSNSDTETLVHLYEEYEEKMLDFLDSEMYAFVIYDKEKNEYFAARDHVGVKPLYYARSNETTYFASEMKQLTQFAEIEEIMIVPPAHYMKNGNLERYSDLIDFKKIVNHDAPEIIDNVKKILHEAVRKRVQTDLPIGVFLSGGIDSTAVLALARKNHNDVTAIIAGKGGSKDREYAERYCKEFNVPYRSIEPPNENHLAKQIEKIIYICETYEPNVIRQSAISYYISKLGADFRVILCGEGADEIFAGYPEFAQADDVNNLCLELLGDLNRTQLQRLDRTSMYFTQEVRVPFLDTKLIEYALSIPGEYKIRSGIKKWILRKSMEHDLPDYICWRKKAVLSEGAGYKGNDPDSGIFTEFIDKGMSEEEFLEIKNKFAQWNIQTKEEAYYFRIFRRFGYCKGKFAKVRVRCNQQRSINEGIIRVLRSRKFSRHPPYRIDEINESDLKFVIFWGALGKPVADEADKETIDFLREFQRHIEKEIGKKIEIRVLLADSHAKMNGIDELDTYTYLQNIKELLESNGFKTEYLSMLWKKWDLDSLMIHRMSGMIEIPDGKLSDSLKCASKKYYNGDPKKGRWVYFAMRQLEKPFLEQEFEGYVFITFNHPCFREILPDMPTLHIRSRKGSSKPPWIPEKQIQTIK
jgi:asparagine synthase (glutamine-hydrolysing)